MTRGWSIRAGAIAALVLAGCGSDPIAGKTTTTTNGGGGLVLAPDGRPVAGALVLAARTWDPERSAWEDVDSLRTDSAGRVSFPSERYAFLEIRDAEGRLGAWTKRPVLDREGERRWILDTLRSLRGRWVDHDGSFRLVLDSSFRATSRIDSNGGFDLGRVAPGEYLLRLVADGGASRPMGRVVLDDQGQRFLGTGNILLEGGTAGSSLWIEDFEAFEQGPLLRRSNPQVAGWYIWSSLMLVSQPKSSTDSAMRAAIGFDSLRGSSVFRARFSSTDPSSWLGFGITRLGMDLSDRSRICLAYRSDTAVVLQLQRDSIGAQRPSMSVTLASSPTWTETCVATSAMVPNVDTPDSLRTWNEFGKSILTLEFNVHGGGTFLDLDDIVLR